MTDPLTPEERAAIQAWAVVDAWAPPCIVRYEATVVALECALRRRGRAGRGGVMQDRPRKECPCGLCSRVREYEAVVQAARAWREAKQHPALRDPRYAVERFRDAQNALADAADALMAAVAALAGEETSGG